MNKTSPQITVEIIIHWINRLGNYNPSSSYNQQYYLQGNYSSPPVYQDQGQRQNFQGTTASKLSGGLEPE